MTCQTYYLLVDWFLLNSLASRILVPGVGPVSGIFR